MREILFRGKRVDGEEWVEGYYLVAAGMPFISAFGIREPLLIDPATVGQFTGLRDKNGKEIFEGDICRGEYGGIVYENEVVFVEGGFSIRHSNDKHGYCALLNEHESKEVVGNIHDNPELVKEAEHVS